MLQRLELFLELGDARLRHADLVGELAGRQAAQALLFRVERT